MGVIDTMKDTVGLIQKIDNIELYRTMMALQTQVVELFEENRALKERLAIRDTLTFKKNVYWRGDAGPFCSRCWDTDSKLVNLHHRKGLDPKCPSCNSIAVDPDREPPKPVTSRRSAPWIQR